MAGFAVLRFTHSHLLDLFLVSSKDHALFICSSHRLLHYLILEMALDLTKMYFFPPLPMGYMSICVYYFSLTSSSETDSLSNSFPSSLVSSTLRSLILVTRNLLHWDQPNGQELPLPAGSLNNQTHLFTACELWLHSCLYLQSCQQLFAPPFYLSDSHPYFGAQSESYLKVGSPWGKLSRSSQPKGLMSSVCV